MFHIRAMTGDSCSLIRRSSPFLFYPLGNVVKVLPYVYGRVSALRGIVVFYGVSSKNGPQVVVALRGEIFYL